MPDIHATREPLHHRIARLRAERGLSQKALGALVGVTPSNVHAWEHGHSVPLFPVGVALAAALGVTPGELMGEE